MNADRRVSLADLLDCVDRVVVITLPSSVERQEFMSSVLSEYDIPFSFLMGKDRRPDSIESLVAAGEYDPFARASHRREEMTPGEIGCAISHRNAAEELLRGQDQRILILEDDAVPSPTGLANFTASMQSMPDSWDLAYFGYAAMNLSTPVAVQLKLISYYPLLHMLGDKSRDPKSISRIYRRPLNSHWMHAGWFNNAHAYAIDRKAAEFIVKTQEPVSLEADTALGHLVRFSGLNAICQKYPLFDQRPGIASTVGPRPSWK